MTVDELREFVLGLDGAVEQSHQGSPDFRRNGRIVVNLDTDDETITIKLGLDEQAALVARDAGAFMLPGGWAKHGWTTISLTRAESDEIRELVRAAWDRAGAKKR
jgi:hypothetical protein